MIFIHCLTTIVLNNYNQIISSIPKEWKTRLKAENINTHHSNSLLDKLLKSDHVNKMLYTFQFNNLKRGQ